MDVAQDSEKSNPAIKEVPTTESVMSFGSLIIQPERHQVSLNNQDELIYVIYSLGLEVKGQEVSKEVVQKMKLQN
mgnify:CR=1 FL=1